MSLWKDLPSSLPLRGGSGMQLAVPCPLERWKRSVALRTGEGRGRGGQADRQTEKQFPHLFWPLPLPGMLACGQPGRTGENIYWAYYVPVCFSPSRPPIPISQRVRHREVKQFAKDHTATKRMSQGPHPPPPPAPSIFHGSRRGVHSTRSVL